jgi:hypothetical protein
MINTSHASSVRQSGHINNNGFIIKQYLNLKKIKNMKTLKLILGCALILAITSGSYRAYAYNEAEPGLNICLDDGPVCKGKCFDDVEGGRTCRTQADNQDCSGTGKAS